MKPGICFRSRKFESHIIFIGQSYFFKTNNTNQFSHVFKTGVGELLWKKLRVTNSFAIHYTHQVQWNGVSLNIIGSHNFYNVGVRLATYANKVPSDGIVGEFYSIPSGFTDIKVVYKNWDVYVVFTVVQGQSVYFKYDCSTQCDIIKDIGFIDESYKEIKPIAQ